MNRLRPIAQFEFRYHLRQPGFYLFAVLILVQGFWTAYQFETHSTTENSSVDAYYILSSFGIVLAIVTVLVAGQALTKDADFKTTSYLYTLPITSRMQFAGRFLGVYLTALTLAVAYPLGVLLCFSVQPHGSGHLPWLALFDGYIRLVALNSFIIVSITFSLTVFLRGMWGTYLSLLLVVLYFLLTESGETSASGSDLWLLLDPFGVGMVREAVNTMSFLAIPDPLLSFSDMLFINRLLWLGLALGALAQAEVRFTFDTFGNQQPKPSSITQETPIHFPMLKPIPNVTLTFGRWEQWQVTLRLAGLEFQNLVRQPIFQITAGLLVILAVILVTAFNLNPEFPVLPTTSRMTALRQPMGLFIGLFLIVMTNELIFHERTIGFWPIYDALPQPTPVLLLAKVIALIGAAFLLTFALFLTGLGLQVSHKFGDIGWPLYAADLLIDGFLRYCQLIALGALVAALVNNRLISLCISLFIFGMLAIAYAISEPNESLFFYTFLPGSATYSDINGYASNTAIRYALHIVWWGVAGYFCTFLLLTFNRGIAGNLRERIAQSKIRFNWSYGAAIAISSVVIGMGLWQIIRQPVKSVQELRAPFRTQTSIVHSVSGRNIAIQVTYYHPYQIPQIMKAAQVAMNRGEELFGAYPFASLQIREVPSGAFPVWSKQGQIDIAEKQGWTADYQQPQKLDYIDYLISREIFKQWLVHHTRLQHKAGDGFIRQSLPEYLALQEISKKYGSERLKQRLLQRTNLYINSRHISRELDVPLLQSNGNDAVERGRGALALTSIGQVWGNKPLSFTISQFYKQSIQQPTSATASAFASQLGHQLPDSLKYLKTYLTDPLWFDFKIGRMANQVNGLNVKIVSAKWLETKPGQRFPLLINDYVPLVVLDQNGLEIYRQLVHLNSDDRFVFLPIMPTAKTVLIDPLGTWPELNKHDNQKIF